MTSARKWIAIVFVCLLVSIQPLSAAHAAENSVYENFQNNSDHQQKSGTASTLSNPPKASMGLYLLQFFGSFLLIIGLLYLVLRFVSKKSKLFPGGGAFHALGGHSFGNNRSLQMLMIGDTLYIIGVGDSVNLIRTIPPGEEQTKLLETVAVKPVDISGKGKWNWGFFKGKTPKEKWDDLFLAQLKEMKSGQSDNKD
ncbi:flagellar biosynthetic protein FliO [Neobacillus sp. 114]|uniref:flagellar biosynthetic protein FliO n=1 Tax=Neobacillus sp. 114 TaxID=3048535 RepID=UPI0024C3FF89|nr:flagellar biosynthetic protein FliO [Neobacillus sp. 114]